MADVIQKFVGTKDWFNESPENQKQALDADFETNITRTERYQKATPEQQQGYRAAYDQIAEETAYDSPHNQANIKKNVKQLKANTGSYWGNWGTKVAEGHGLVAAKAGLIDDALNPDGKVDPNAPGQMSKYFQKENQKIYTRESKKFASSILRLQKTIDAGGAINQIKGWGRFLSEIPENIGGIGHLAADSASSLTVMGGGAKTGTMIGTGVTAATGGFAAPAIPFFAAGGMFAAEVMDAGGSKFLERIRGELEANNIALTETNIKMFLDKNPDFVKDSQEDSLKYGGALGVVDVALGGLFSRIASLPTKVARAEAMRGIDSVTKAALKAAAKKKNMSVKAFTDLAVDDIARQTLKSRSLKSKLGSKLTSYTGEVLSEPASEAIATAAAGEENTTTNLLNETFGGIGAGPYGAAINTAAFGTKLASKQATETAKDLITPVSPKEKRSRKLNKARSKFGFNKEVKEADSDTSVEQYTDINDEENYDPMRAVAILGQSDRVTAHTEARQVLDDFTESVMADAQRADDLELKVKNSPESVTKEDVAELKALNKSLPIDSKTIQTLTDYVGELDEKLNKQNADQDIEDLDTKTATDEQVVDNIVKSLGSNGNKKAITNSKIKRLGSRKDLSKTTQAVIKATEVFSNKIDELKTYIAKSKKSVEEVHSDIIHGKRGSDFKGINAYMRSITDHIENGRISEAEKELVGLDKFYARHGDKSAKATSILKSLRANIPLTPQQEAYKAELEATGLVIFDKSGRLVNTMHMEAQALAAAVKAAQSLIDAKKGKTDTEANTADQTSTEEPIQTPTEDNEANPPEENRELPPDPDTPPNPQPEQVTESTTTIDKNVQKAIDKIAEGNFTWAEKAIASPKITKAQKAILVQKLKEAKEALAKKQGEQDGDQKESTTEGQQEGTEERNGTEIEDGNLQEVEESAPTDLTRAEARRNGQVQSHVDWNKNSHNYDAGHEGTSRLKDIRIYELIQNFFESSIEKGKVKRLSVDDGNESGGTRKNIPTQSSNPQWVQDLYKNNGTNAAGVITAIQHALKGTKKPTVKQAISISAVIDAALADIDARGITLEDLENQTIQSIGRELGLVSQETEIDNEEVSYYDEEQPAAIQNDVDIQAATAAVNTEVDVNDDTDTDAAESKDAMEEYENTDMSSLKVTTVDAHGNISERPFYDAVAEKSAEIKEFEELLSCLTPN